MKAKFKKRKVRKNRTKNRIARNVFKKHYLKILYYVSKKYNPSAISKLMNRSRSTISGHLKTLKDGGFLELEFRSNITQYKLTNKGKQTISVFSTTYGDKVQDLITDRGHNIKLKSKIIRFAKDKDFMNDWKVKFLHRGSNKRMPFYRKFFDKILVEITPANNITFQLPELWFKDADTVMMEAGRIIERLINYLEDEYKGLKIGTPKILSNIISQHHAIPSDPFAKFLCKNNINYRDEVINIDASKTPEIEFTDSKDGRDHWNRYVMQVKDTIINNPPTNSQLSAAIYESIKMQEVYNFNIEKHLNVLDQMNITLKKISTNLNKK